MGEKYSCGFIFIHIVGHVIFAGRDPKIKISVGVCNSTFDAAEVYVSFCLHRYLPGKNTQQSSRRDVVKWRRDGLIFDTLERVYEGIDIYAIYCAGLCLGTKLRANQYTSIHNNQPHMEVTIHFLKLMPACGGTGQVWGIQSNALIWSASSFWFVATHWWYTKNNFWMFDGASSLHWEVLQLPGAAIWQVDFSKSVWGHWWSSRIRENMVLEREEQKLISQKVRVLISFTSGGTYLGSKNSTYNHTTQST